MIPLLFQLSYPGILPLEPSRTARSSISVTFGSMHTKYDLPNLVPGVGVAPTVFTTKGTRFTVAGSRF